VRSLEALRDKVHLDRDTEGRYLIGKAPSA
jgi:hypothetical protein